MATRNPDKVYARQWRRHRDDFDMAQRIKEFRAQEHEAFDNAKIPVPHYKRFYAKGFWYDKVSPFEETLERTGETLG